MNRKYLVAGLLSLVLVFSAGCGQKPAAAPNDPVTTTPEQVKDLEKVDKEVTPPVDKGDQTTPAKTGGTQAGQAENNNTETQEKKASIKLYYTDPDLMEVKDASKEISYTDEVNKYEKAFEGLQQSGDDQLVPLWDDSIKLTSVKFEEGALTLDIVKPDEANLGSGGELFAIEALRNTYFQFDEVKSIELLVEGKKIESLMGHVMLEHPMTR
ncbi:GerMN domain-containing protein [Paenibacillus dakarensis]|uniref:GerMN domain-containing protein n=1 Tax=Paenibacillus dakarensis TaxID=1527293 RepID=UPI0006D58F1C|nr:GerMN domain-containing protein [Paenibacillus dakarensis]